MKTVILAGGLGTRLRPTVSNVPKPMAEVLGKPFLEWQINLLKKFDLRDIVLSIGYMGDKIKNHFMDGGRFGVHIEYVEEDQPLGTGGSLKIVKPCLSSKEDFLVMNGDTYLDLDFSGFVKFHREKKALTTIALTQINRLSKCGCVELDANSRIASFVEREKGEGIINAGVHAFTNEVFAYMPRKRNFSLEFDLFPNLIRTKRVFGYLTRDYFRDIGRPEDYEAIKRDLKGIV